MNRHDPSVAFLGTFNHPAGGGKYGHPSHEGFAETISADAIPFDTPSRIPLPSSTLRHIALCAKYPMPEYDVYIPGTSRMMYAVPLIKSLYPDSRIIYMVTDIFMYGMDIYPEFDGLYGYKRYFDKKIDILLLRKIARRYVDGAIAASQFAADFTQPILGVETPMRVANPYIQPGLYERLSAVDPDLSANSAVFVGIRFNGCKGIDLLIDAWNTVRERFPDAELTIVGPDHREHHDPSPGVEFTGFVSPEDLPNVFESKSLYIHPARVDTFPLSTLEAMRAGLPAIVTRTTGTRSVAEGVDGSMITDANSSAIARAIIEYFSRDAGDRRELSQRARRETEEFNSASKKREFKNAFDTLMTEIGHV